MKITGKYALPTFCKNQTQLCPFLCHNSHFLNKSYAHLSECILSLLSLVWNTMNFVNRLECLSKWEYGTQHGTNFIDTCCVCICVSLCESTCQEIPQKWKKWNFDDGTGKIRIKWKMCPTSRYDRASTSYPILTRATASATFKWRLHRNPMKYERYFVYIACACVDVDTMICLYVYLYISRKPLKSQQRTFSYLYISFSSF